MHSFLAIAPLLVASALAQSTDTTTTVPYSNPFTTLTTETNSLGVVTGMPSQVTTQPTVVTTQPSVASIPAGLTAGVYTLPYGNMSSFTISVGSGTTVIVSSTSTTSSASGASANAASGSAHPSSTSAPANVVPIAGGWLVGVVGFVAALL